MLALIFAGQASADVTAPVLSLPTGASTGQTTATGTVSTDEAGTLYFWATQNTTETAANIKASGSSQAATTGVQNVSFTGLTAGTAYYTHYVEDDAAANESNVVTSTVFTTTALTACTATGKTTFPVWAKGAWCDGAWAKGAWNSTATRPAGGFWISYAAEELRKRREAAEREKKRKLAQKIQNKLDRALALAQRKLEEDQARDKELSRLTDIAIMYQSDLRQLVSERASFVALEAINRHTYSAMERLERELGELIEEEQFLALATQLLVMDQ